MKLNPGAKPGFLFSDVPNALSSKLDKMQRPKMTWHPHITVATIVEADGRFLMVEESKGGRLVLNQPAGHLEPDETLRQAAVRETLEETGWEVQLEGVVGIYLYTAPSNGVTYQRVCFSASPIRHDSQRELDTGIVAALWLTRDELARQPERWRSELILRCIDDYLTGPTHDLAVIRD
jgi:8-oxo-dGTP pyrophosphatase MutT (NUDIX family)|tara:strand:- start:2691 stop:3224 length:534 start_codon:yes stop_codon:yes gene_type:complete